MFNISIKPGESYNGSRITFCFFSSVWAVSHAITLAENSSLAILLLEDQTHMPFMGLLMTCPRFAIFLFILTSLTFHILFICYPQATYSLCDALNLQFTSCLSAFPVQFSTFFLHGTNSIWIHGTTQMESLPLVFTSTLDTVWSRGGSPESVWLTSHSRARP